MSDTPRTEVSLRAHEIIVANCPPSLPGLPAYASKCINAMTEEIGKLERELAEARKMRDTYKGWATDRAAEVDAVTAYAEQSMKLICRMVDAFEAITCKGDNGRHNAKQDWVDLDGYGITALIDEADALANALAAAPEPPAKLFYAMEFDDLGPGGTIVPSGDPEFPLALAAYCATCLGDGYVFKDGVKVPCSNTTFHDTPTLVGGTPLAIGRHEGGKA